MSSDSDLSLKPFLKLSQFVHSFLELFIKTHCDETETDTDSDSQDTGDVQFKLSPPSPKFNHLLNKEEQKLYAQCYDFSRKLNSILIKLSQNELSPEDRKRLVEECKSLAAQLKTLLNKYQPYQHTLLSKLLKELNDLYTKAIDATYTPQANQREGQTPSPSCQQFHPTPFKMTCTPSPSSHSTTKN